MSGDYDGRQYVGIDLHRRRSVIVRMTRDGEQLGWVRIDNDPVALGLELAKAGPDPEVVLEATYGWYWAVDVLQTAGAARASGAPAGSEGVRLPAGEERCARRRRSGGPAADGPAARGLHRHPARAGAARAGAPPGQAGRPAVRVEGAGARACWPSRAYCLPVSDVFGPAGQAWLRSAPLELVYRAAIDSLLELIDAYDGEIDVFRTMIANRFTGHRGYRAIQQISGIGPTFAAVFVAEIGDVTRFSRPEKLCCWAGLTPRHRESDTTVHRGPITKQGSKLVRWAAIEACQHTRAGQQAVGGPGPDHRRPRSQHRRSSPRPADCSPWSSTACATVKSARSPRGPGERVRTRQGARSCCVMTPTSSSAWSPA